MQPETSHASLPCVALPISESERQEWHDAKTIATEPKAVENGAQLQAYEPASQSVVIRVDVDQWPAYAHKGEVRLSLPQLRDWMRAQGVWMGQWYPIESPEESALEPSGEFLTDKDGLLTTIPLYRVKPGRNLSAYMT